MTQFPATIPGWQQLGYEFVDSDNEDDPDRKYGYVVLAPGGRVVGEVHDSIPEAATAAACIAARDDYLANH